MIRLARLPIAIDAETDAHLWTTTLQLADSFQLTLYDAAYLELALRLGLPLATPRRNRTANPTCRRTQAVYGGQGSQQFCS
jgi:predicted nucleic acid-binding protein